MFPHVCRCSDCCSVQYDDLSQWNGWNTNLSGFTRLCVIFSVTLCYIVLYHVIVIMKPSSYKAVTCSRIWYQKLVQYYKPALNGIQLCSVQLSGTFTTQMMNQTTQFLWNFFSSRILHELVLDFWYQKQIPKHVTPIVIFNEGIVTCIVKSKKSETGWQQWILCLVWHLWRLLVYLISWLTWDIFHPVTFCCFCDALDITRSSCFLYSQPWWFSNRNSVWYCHFIRHSIHNACTRSDSFVALPVKFIKLVYIFRSRTDFISLSSYC